MVERLLKKLKERSMGQEGGWKMVKPNPIVYIWPIWVWLKKQAHGTTVFGNISPLWATDGLCPKPSSTPRMFCNLETTTCRRRHLLLKLRWRKVWVKLKVKHVPLLLGIIGLCFYRGWLLWLIEDFNQSEVVLSWLVGLCHRRPSENLFVLTTKVKDKQTMPGNLSQFTCQPTNQPTKQPTNQPTNQASKQASISKPFHASTPPLSTGSPLAPLAPAAAGLCRLGPAIRGCGLWRLLCFCFLFIGKMTNGILLFGCLLVLLFFFHIVFLLFASFDFCSCVLVVHLVVFCLDGLCVGWSSRGFIGPSMCFVLGIGFLVFIGFCEFEWVPFSHVHRCVFV